MNDYKDILIKTKLLIEYDRGKTVLENNVLLEQQLEYDSYYKKEFLSKKIQSSLFDSVGVPYGARPNESRFRVQTQSEWYAVFALWYSQEIESLLAAKWQYKPEGACPKNLKMPKKELCKSNIKKRLEYNSKSSADYNVQTICYDEEIFYSKPFDKINYNNLTVSDGRLSNSSINRYNGHIPSYADVITCYGPNFIDTFNLIQKSNLSLFYNRSARGMKPGQQSVQLSDITYKGFTMDDLHNLLMVLEIGTAFIPVAGPVISAALGTVDASLYYAEGDKDMGVFMLLVTLVPELKVASNITKSAKLMKGQKEIEKRILQGKGLKNLTQFELEFIEGLKTLNPKQLNKELTESIGRRADNILQTQSKNLTEQQKAYLRQYSKIYNTEYFALDMLTAAVAATQTKIGKELLNRLSNLFVKNNIELDEKTAQKIIKSFGELEPKNQETLVTVFEENKEEFVAFANNPEEITTALKGQIKTKSKSKQFATKDEMSQMLEVIPDDFD
jgi:hypothetical protein